MREPKPLAPPSSAAASTAASDPAGRQWEVDKATSAGLLAVRNDIDQARTDIVSGNAADARAALEDVISRLGSDDRAGAPKADVHRQLLASVAYSVLGQALDAEGDLQEAHDAFSRAVAGFRSLPPRFVLTGYRSDFGIALDAVGEDGVTVLQEAVEGGEATPEAYRRLGMILHGRGDLNGAERALLESLELAPGDIRTLGALGHVLADAQEPEQAASAFHDMGWRLGALDRLDEALAAFDRAAELDPSNQNAHGGRGEALRLLGRLDEALAAFDRVLAVEPDSAWALASKGAALATLARDQEAVELLDRAVELDPTYTFALFTRGEALSRLSRREDALADLERVATIEPERWRVWTVLGRVRVEMGDFPGALEAFERAFPDDPDALVGKAQALLALERYQDAAGTARVALALNPSLASASALEGEALRLLNNLPEALSALDHAIDVAPDFSWALATRAQVLLSTGRIADGVADLRRAIQLGPPLPWAHSALGEALHQLGRHEEALVELDRALELAPEDPAALRLKAATFVTLERYDEALTVLDAHALAHPENAVTMIIRAGALAEVERFEEAEAAYRRAASMAPDDPRPLSGLARLLVRLGRPRDALHAADEAVGRSDDDDAVAVRGSVLRRVGRYAEAVTVLQGVAAREDPPAWVLAELSDALRLLNRNHEAIDAADRALSVEPGNTMALGSKAAALFMVDRDDEALKVVDDALAVDGTYAFGLRLRGNIHAWSNRADLALHSYDAVLRLDPDDHATLVAKGSVFTYQGKYGEAVDLFDRALGIDPGNGDALYGKAEALRLLSRFDEAEAVLEAVLASRSDDARVVRSWGYVLIGQNRYEEAEAVLRRAQQLAPQEAVAFADLALVNRLLERHDVGLEAAQRAVELGADPWSLAVYADLLIDVGRYIQAIEVLDQALELDNRNADNWTRKGWALQQVGDRAAQAREAYESALAIDESNIWARKGRGDVRRELGEAGDSDYELALSRALEAEANDPLTRAVAGWCHYGLRRYDEAVELFLSVLASSPGLISAQFDLALTMLSRGHASPALREYERAIAQLHSVHRLHRLGLATVAKRDVERERQTNADLSQHERSLETITRLLDGAADAARSRP